MLGAAEQAVVGSGAGMVYLRSPCIDISDSRKSIYRNSNFHKALEILKSGGYAWTVSGRVHEGCVIPGHFTMRA